MSHLEGTEKIRVSTVDRFLIANRYSVCVTVILATDVLEPNTGPSSLFILKPPLLLSPNVCCIRWDVIIIVYYHICSVYQTQ